MISKILRYLFYSILLSLASVLAGIALKCFIGECDASLQDILQWLGLSQLSIVIFAIFAESCERADFGYHLGRRSFMDYYPQQYPPHRTYASVAATAWYTPLISSILVLLYGLF